MRKIFVAVLAAMLILLANQTLAATYLANTNSGKFHCRRLPTEQKRIVERLEELLPLCEI